jgi:hypothetical protein
LARGRVAREQILFTIAKRRGRMLNREADVTREEAQTALARILLERVRGDRHPSRTHMQMLEQILPPWLYRDYINVLLEKVLDDPHPSIPMINHLVRITEGLPAGRRAS